MDDGNFEHRVAEKILDTVLYKKLHHLGYRPMTTLNWLGGGANGAGCTGGIGGGNCHRQGFEQRLNNKLLNALMIDKVGLHENSLMNMDEINPDMPFNDRLNARLMDIVISRKFGRSHRHVDNPMQDPESHVGRGLGLKVSHTHACYITVCEVCIAKQTY